MESRGIGRADLQPAVLARWDKQLARAVSSAATATFARAGPSKPFRSVRLWRMVNAFKKKKKEEVFAG